jgi:peptidoglycan/xylan/chitin deacetylase (PgdA/CDA1 family)
MRTNKEIMQSFNKLSFFGRLKRYVLRNYLGFGTITHVDTTDNVVSLTFDDGPDPHITPEILKLLKNHKAKATFFMLGKNARRYPHIVKQVFEGGHAIGNHSYDHPSFSLITSRERRSQLRDCQSAIAPYGNRLLRPPFGHQTLASRLDALLLRYSVFTWSVHGEDWLDHDADWIAYRIEKEIHPGSIILLHDHLNNFYDQKYANRRPMLNAVSILLERLSVRFDFVTVPELLHHGSAYRSYWVRKVKPEWSTSLVESK